MLPTAATMVGASMSRQLDVDGDAAPVALLCDLERDDPPAVRLDRLEHRHRAAAGGNVDKEPIDLGPVAADDPVRGDAQRPERQERAGRRDQSGAVVARARRHADRRDEPESRRGGEAADREPLADDRAGSEEADAAHDLRCDPRRVGADDRAAVHEELVEAVGRDEREQRRADATSEVRAQARLPLAQLALECRPRRRAPRRPRAAAGRAAR